jgi:hypothetical protein
MKLDEARSSETSMLTHESMRCQNPVDYRHAGPGYCETMRILNKR